MGQREQMPMRIEENLELTDSLFQDCGLQKIAQFQRFMNESYYSNDSELLNL